MKVLAAAALYGLVAASGVLAQGSDIPDLIADGPFALRVKGRCNSSVDGYLHAVDVYSFDDQQVVLHYDASPPASLADNSSYRFYFNHTGRMQSDDGYELGFIVSDITVGEPNGVGLLGKAMSLQYRPNTNVALPSLGAAASTVDLTGFNSQGRAFLNYYTDDATAVAGKPANVSLSVDYYGWAVCWQTYFAITGPTLSWITTGKPHNPTCERVDLIKTKL